MIWLLLIVLLKQLLQIKTQYSQNFNPFQFRLKNLHAALWKLHPNPKTFTRVLQSCSLMVDQMRSSSPLPHCSIVPLKLKISGKSRGRDSSKYLRRRCARGARGCWQTSIIDNETGTCCAFKQSQHLWIVPISSSWAQERFPWDAWSRSNRHQWVYQYQHSHHFN